MVLQQRPSRFVSELIQDYSAVQVNGDLDISKTDSPDICDFMTNDLSGGRLPILKCDCCKDGYLIVKKKDNTPFLGCTNYKPDKSGCNRKINLKYYENMLKRGEIEL